MARHALVAATFSALALLTLVLCDRVVDVCVDRAVERRYADLFTGPERLDAIVIGSSHGEFCIDVAALEAPGLRPYNFSNAASGPLYFAAWYEVYRAHVGKARWALISAEWFWTRMVRTLREDVDSLPAATWLEMMRARPRAAGALCAQRFALLKEQAEFLRIGFAEPAQWNFDMARYYRGGTPIVQAGYRAGKVDGRNAYRQPVPAGSAAAFRRLCEQLRADGTRVVFVQTPEYTPHAGDHPLDTQAIAALAREFGWPFLNYNAERASAFNHDQAMFTDWNHLNPTGRARFSARLRLDLDALGALAAGPRGS